MALYKYHYIELDTKRSPRISLQNIVAGETGNRIWVTVTNNGSTIDMSEKSSGEFIYRVALRIDSDLGTRRQDSDDPDGGITFIEENTGDHGKINILLSADSFTVGKNRCRLEIYSKRSEADDTLICSAEWTFDAAGNPTGENCGTAYPVMAYYEQLAKSWAVGGTGKREGEDADNSKFYSEMAQEAVDQQVVAPSITAWLTANYPEIADDMADDISAWLAEHMTNPSNPAIDTSLSVSGAAADAKVTGNIKKAEKAITGLDYLPFINGAYIKTVAVGSSVDLTPISTSGMCYAVADCVAGQEFYITGKPFNNSAKRPCMFVDNTNTCLERDAWMADLTNQKVIAPTGAVKIIVNLQNGYGELAVAGGVPDLNSRILSADTNISALNASKADKNMIVLPFDLENEHYSLECIHHDNFNRTPETEFDVGQNGNETVPMNYTFDTDTNDVYKIDGNVLTIGSSGDTRGMFLVNKPNRNFAVTLGLVRPTTSDSLYTNFVWNYDSSSDCYEFRIMRYLSNGRILGALYVYKRESGVESTLYVTNGDRLSYDAVTLVFVNNTLHIYAGNTLLKSVDNIEVDVTKRFGMFIRTLTAHYEWKSVSVFNVGTITLVDAGTDSDRSDYNTLSNGKKLNASVAQAIAGSVYDYLMNRDSDVARFSPYSERFVLKYVDGTSTSAKNDSRRSEASIFQKPNGCLFRALASFDFCLPSDYQPETDPTIADDDFEIIAQFHYDSTDGLVGYNPTPCLKIMNGDLYVSQWGRPEPNKNYADSPAVTKSETFLKTLTPGRWYHIDLFVRSGYESAHNPLVDVKIDGELLYRSMELNCPNTVGSVVFHYGIYKYQWYARQVGNVRTKTYYFDNMKVRWF